MLKRAASNPVERFMQIFTGKPRVFAKTTSASGVTEPIGVRPVKTVKAAADSGTPASIGDGQTLTIAGAAPISTAVSGNTVTVSHDTSGIGAGAVAYPASITFDTTGHATAATGGSAPMTNPMTAAGDLIYGDTPSGGVAPPKRLAPGSEGAFLEMASSSAPGWIGPCTDGSVLSMASGHLAEYSVTSPGIGGVHYWNSTGFANTGWGEGGLIFQCTVAGAQTAASLTAPSGDGWMLAFNSSVYTSPYWQRQNSKIVQTITGNVTLTDADHVILSNAAFPTSPVATLPTAVTGTTLYFRNINSGVCQITAAAGESVEGGASYNLPAGCSVIVIAVAASTWIIFGASKQGTDC